MNGKELLDKLELVDAAYVEAAASASGKKSRHWLRLGALAACLCLLIAGAAFLPGLLPGSVKPPPETTQPVQPPPPTSTEPTTQPTETTVPTVEPQGQRKTSDIYEDLSQLLAYLSDNEEHGGTDSTSRRIQSEISAEDTEMTLESQMVTDSTGKYLYAAENGAVHLSRLEGAELVPLGTLELPVGRMMIQGDTLVILTHTQLDDNGGYRAELSIYDISSPEQPVFLDRYSQQGTRSALWMADGKLYLITGDGMCACGWSRLEDPAGYYPALWHNDTPVEWTDEDISILGEPTRVQYAAMTVLDTETWQVLEKEAVYGNIRNLYYGKDWIAVAVAKTEAVLSDNSLLYTFDEQLCYTDKLDTNHILGITEPVTFQGSGLIQSGEWIELLGVTRQEGIYRLLGHRYGLNSGDFLVAIAARPETGEATVEQMDMSAYYRLSEITWDGDRAILAVPHAYTGSDVRRCDLLMVEFDGLSVNLWNTGLQADYHNGTVNATYGNPLGHFETMIPLGNGIYVRYSLPVRLGAACAFDIFDFSDSSNPKCLYRADQYLSGKDVYDFVWHVYDENTFGTLKVILNYQAESLDRDVQMAWCIYRVDPDSQMPFTQIAEIPVGDTIDRYTGGLFQILEIQDRVYYRTKRFSEPYGECIPLPMP